MEDNRKRNMERRRETSRYAARDRRFKEGEIFDDLKKVVPIVEEGTVTHLDRIALLRVAATICRLRKTAGNVLENELDSEFTNEVWNEETIAECLDGFVMIVDSDSSILYVTESVALYLGLTQTDLTGRALRDFLHPSDYDEFDKQTKLLHKPRGEESDATGVDMVLRMKTVISPRGRCLNLKSALYKSVSFLVHSKVSTGGHVSFMQGITIPAGQGTTNANASAMTKYTESPMGAFTTRHTCDMRITFVSDKFNYILKSELKTLMGTSYYELVHPADMAIVAKAMKELFAKGHIRTPYYRLIAANDTLAWIQTEATTITHTTKGQKGQYVICVHYVLGIQGAEESLVVCTDAMPAGMQVDIKKEIDDTRDYIGRQPEIVECVDFTPLIETEDPFEIEQIMPQQEPSKPADMGIYSVTDEYEQRVYGKVTSSDDFLNSTEPDDMESDCESIEDAGLAPEFDVDLVPFYGEKMDIGGDEDYGEEPVKTATMMFCNGFFATSQALRHRHATGQRTASDRPPRRRISNPLWPRRSSWIRHLVPPDRKLPMVEERKALEVERRIHQVTLDPHRPHNRTVPTTRHWQKAFHNVDLTVPQVSNLGKSCTETLDLWSAAAIRPIRHDAFPPFHHQILSMCRPLNFHSPESTKFPMCSPLCLLPILSLTPTRRQTVAMTSTQASTHRQL